MNKTLDDGFSSNFRGKLPCFTPFLFQIDGQTIKELRLGSPIWWTQRRKAKRLFRSVCAHATAGGHSNLRPRIMPASHKQSHESSQKTRRKHLGKSEETLNIRIHQQNVERILRVYLRFVCCRTCRTYHPLLGRIPAFAVGGTRESSVGPSAVRGGMKMQKKMFRCL